MPSDFVVTKTSSVRLSLAVRDGAVCWFCSADPGLPLLSVLRRKFLDGAAILVCNPCRVRYEKRLPMRRDRPEERKWGKVSPVKRQLVIERDGRRCGWCEREVFEDVPQTAANRLTIDHRVPKAKGGTNHLSNLLVACGACNKRKADQHPDDFVVTAPPAAPGEGKYRLHFTGKGRARFGHDTAEAALVAAEELRAEGKTIESFQCPTCHLWHNRMPTMLVRQIAEQRQRLGWEDLTLLYLELGDRAVNLIRRENGPHARGRIKAIGGAFRGAERRARAYGIRPGNENDLPSSVTGVSCVA